MCSIDQKLDLLFTPELKQLKEYDLILTKNHLQPVHLTVQPVRKDLHQLSHVQKQKGS